jgi:UDPglucose 6-dehydrogenase
VIQNLRHPDLVIIGAEDNHTAVRVEGLLSRLWHEPLGESGHLVPVASPYTTRLSLVEAEVAKLAVNAYVTMKISFANTVAEACEHMPGADATRVLRAIAHDLRIGAHYLRPGGPYGGPCFPRDTTAVAAWLADCGMPADLAHATRAVNDRQAWRIAAMVRHHHRIAVLGLSYKPGTMVTDESLGLRLIPLLRGEGHEVQGYDPGGGAEFTEQEMKAADALIIATAHPQYALLDVGGKPTVDVWGCLTPQPGVRTIGRWALAQ